MRVTELSKTVGTSIARRLLALADPEPALRPTAVFGAADHDSEWEANRRAVGAFYSAQGRYPTLDSPYPSERRLASWVAAELAECEARDSRQLMLELTPGWRARRSRRHAV
jgi:hypothetical protein